MARHPRIQLRKQLVVLLLVIFHSDNIKTSLESTFDTTSRTCTNNQDSSTWLAEHTEQKLGKGRWFLGLVDDITRCISGQGKKGRVIKDVGSFTRILVYIPMYGSCVGNATKTSDFHSRGKSADRTFNIMVFLDPVNLLYVVVAAVLQSFFYDNYVVSLMNDNPDMVTFGVDGVELLTLSTQPIHSHLVIIGENLIAKRTVKVHSICGVCQKKCKAR